MTTPTILVDKATLTFSDGTSILITIREIKLEHGWCSNSSKTRDVDITIVGESEIDNPDYKEPAPKKAAKKPMPMLELEDDDSDVV